MSPLAIVFGVLLTLLGPSLYFAVVPDERSPTAFIPTGFGIALILLGVIARNDKYRMHAMHVAALLGLVGFAFPGGRVIYAWRTQGDAFHLDKPAIFGQIIMSALCLVFLVLCVKSFIAARVARKQREAAGQP